MESLLLSFDAEQYKKYTEILQTQEVELCFDTEVLTPELYDLQNARNIVAKMRQEALLLMTFSKRDSFFVSSLSKDEINTLIPTYYKVVREITTLRKELYTDAITLSQSITELRQLYGKLEEEYASFLPYKVALYNRNGYSDRIKEIDAQFKQSITMLRVQIKDQLSNMEFIRKITDDFVTMFFKETSKSSDEPNFENFDHRSFFRAIESFILKTKSI